MGVTVKKRARSPDWGTGAKREAKSKAAHERSPLKARPLRNPGESAHDALLDYIFENPIAYVFVGAGMLALCATKWLEWFFHRDLHPKWLTLYAIPIAIYCAFKVSRSLARVRAMKLGRDGEKAVGQYLETLRADGALILHDYPGDGFNIDHIVFHTSGVYVVETKTYSKPKEGLAEIYFDGERVDKRGYALPGDPVGQVRGATAWLSELIDETIGVQYPVRPVLLFPGWYIKSTAPRGSAVWALNPKAFRAFMLNQSARLSPSEVRRAHCHLSRHARHSLEIAL